LRGLLAASILVLLLPGCVGAPLRPAATDAPSFSCVGPCKLPIDATAHSGWEPHAAVDPLDPQHVVVATRTLAATLPVNYVLWFDVHDSRDGGRTWNVTELRYTEPMGTPSDPTAPNVVGDPVLAFLPDGTLLATGATLRYVSTPGGGVLTDVRLYSVRSPDGGRHFEEPVTVARSQGAGAEASLPVPLPSPPLFRTPDKPWLATGPDGTALLTYTDIAGGEPSAPARRSDIAFVVSRDGGRSWSAPGFVARGADLQGSAPAIGSEGAWYVGYVDLAARTAHVAASRDQGATWTDRAVAPADWMPSLAVARESGRERVLLVAPAPQASGEMESVPHAPTLSWSDDGGATWTAPLPLDQPEAPGRILPSVAADARGVVYVTFAHATAQGARMMAVALRPGSWRADLTLDPDIAAPPSSLGDYLGLAAGPAGAFAVWTTTKDGRSFDTAGALLSAEPL